MQEQKAPENWEALLRGFAQAVEQLRDARAAGQSTVDPTLGGTELFRDPERLSEAAAFVERALAGAVPPAGPQAAFARATFEESPLATRWPCAPPTR